MNSRKFFSWLGFSLVILPALALAAGFGFDAAAAQALKEVPGGKVTSIEKDFEFGRSVIEVEVDAPDGREHELIFDAADGALLDHRIDD